MVNRAPVPLIPNNYRVFPAEFQKCHHRHLAPGLSLKIADRTAADGAVMLVFRYSMHPSTSMPLILDSAFELPEHRWAMIVCGIEGDGNTGSLEG